MAGALEAGPGLVAHALHHSPQQQRGLGCAVQGQQGVAGAIGAGVVVLPPAPRAFATCASNKVGKQTRDALPGRNR